VTIPPPMQGSTQIIIQSKNLVCGGPHSLIWVLFNYGCVVLTQVAAVILAFLTRKVTIKALNDSKYLTIIIYTSSVIIALMLISAVLIDEYLNFDAAVFGGLIMLFTTVVLGLTFIPKVILRLKEFSMRKHILILRRWLSYIKILKGNIFLNVDSLKGHSI
jgi:hypothetical protein